MHNEKSSSVASYTPRMQAAFVRAEESLSRLKRIADRVTEEIDEVTAPHGVPIMELDDEDSMVIAVERVIEARKS